MLRLASSPEAAVVPPSTYWASRGAVVRWLSAIIGALLALILGMTLLQHTITEHSPSPTTPRRGLAPGRGLSSLPLTAQGVVSTTLGADDPAYRVTAASGGFQAQSPAQHLRMHFESAGVQIGSGKTQVGLSLHAMGYGTDLRPVYSVRPSSRANGVTYTHTDLSEWYRNGPLGLEQGFTIPKAPSGHPTGALTLSMALSGNAHASLTPDGKSIIFSRYGGPSLRYDGLTATDAGGRALHSWLALYRGRIMLRVDTRGARYPLRIDPFVQQGPKLTATGEEPEGVLGCRVALSADGDTALVSAPGNTNAIPGEVFVFQRSEEVWSQQGPGLTPNDGEPREESQFGQGVALSADGDTALVGGPIDNDNTGAAWVFTRTGTTWEQQGPKLTASDETGEAYFGASVALSADGDTALIGGPNDRTNSGAAWVFERSGSTWEQQGPKLTASSSVARGIGGDVALAADGSTALLGAFAPGGSENWGGTALVFTRSGGSWAQQGAALKADPSEVVGEYLSEWSVALSGDGDTALVGDIGDNDLAGAAWVFTRSGSSWSQDGPKLVPNDESGAEGFGQSVSLSGEGDVAIVGGAGYDGSTGAAWVFRRSVNSWSQLGSKLTDTELEEPEEDSEFGVGVALSEDGHTAIVGAINADNATGAAFVFTNFGERPTVVSEPASSVTHTSATLNATVNPGGSAVTECKFEYGISTSYGSSAPCSALPGEGSSQVAVSAPVESLSESTTYHFRIVATNAGGTSYGSDARFTTLGPPDFGRCVKVAAEREGKKTVYHGKFTAATCLVESLTKSGKYEWSPGVAKAHFTSTLKEGRTTLETVAKVKVACNTEGGVGEYSGTKEVADVIVRLTGCETSGHKCTTPGLAEGELQTKTLEGELGWEAKASKKVALDLYPIGRTGAFMEYRCIGGVPVTVTGSILVPIEADKMLLTTPLKYKASKGKQKPEQLEGEPSDVLTASLNGEIFEQLGWTANLTQTNEEAIEINTTV